MGTYDNSNTAQILNDSLMVGYVIGCTGLMNALNINSSHSPTKPILN